MPYKDRVTTRLSELPLECTVRTIHDDEGQALCWLSTTTCSITCVLSLPVKKVDRQTLINGRSFLSVYLYDWRLGMHTIKHVVGDCRLARKQLARGELNSD